MTAAHDFVTIAGRQVLHSAAVRDYVCGDCGGALVTLFIDGEWRTVCGGEMSHPADGFVTKTKWAWLRHNQAMKADEARQVLTHLPAGLQAILAPID